VMSVSVLVTQDCTCDGGAAAVGVNPTDLHF